MFFSSVWNRITAWLYRVPAFPSPPLPLAAARTPAACKLTSATYLLLAAVTFLPQVSIDSLESSALRLAAWS